MAQPLLDASVKLKLELLRLGLQFERCRQCEVSRKLSILCKVYTSKRNVLHVPIWNAQNILRMFWLDIKHGKGEILHCCLRATEHSVTAVHFQGKPRWKLEQEFILLTFPQ